ncbi:MAG: DUF3141 domain-containing protein, partial [Candidatus Binataceae bacterium]
MMELAGEPIRAKLTAAPGNGLPFGGIKVIAQNGWFAARPSGTEDIYKIYAENVRDFWQRSVLFLDILRQRGNQREEMLAHGATSVLIYDSELVMRG